MTGLLLLIAAPLGQGNSLAWRVGILVFVLFGGVLLVAPWAARASYAK